MCRAYSTAALAVLVTCIFGACRPALTADSSAVPAVRGKAVSAAGAAAAAADWPVFRGDPQSTGVARSGLPEQPDLIWQFPVEKGSFEGTPAIVDGVVYIGDLDGKVYALDLATGRQKWVHPTDSGFIASPAVRDGLVFIGDYDGRFHCLSAADGSQVWQYEAEAEIDSGANFHGPHVLFGSQDATLYCLVAATGKLVWKHAIEDQIRCTPTVVEGRGFVAGCDGQLHILSLEDGQERAAVPIESPTGVTPAVLGEHVFFGTEGGTFFCIDWRRAEVVWTFAAERGLSFRSSPAVTPGIVVFGARNRRVYALDPATGKELWQFSARQRVDASPVIVGQRVFVAAADGRLYALSLKDGSELWQYETGGGFAGSPAVADGRLVIANDQGVVYCFGQRQPF